MVILIFLFKIIRTVTACIRGSGSLINHKKKRIGANARFSPRKNGIFIYALRDIKEGEEIFADYGSNYIFDKNLMLLINDNKVGESTSIFKKWYSGWDEKNNQKLILDFNLKTV